MRYQNLIRKATTPKSATPLNDPEEEAQEALNLRQQETIEKEREDWCKTRVTTKFIHDLDSQIESILNIAIIKARQNLPQECMSEVIKIDTLIKTINLAREGKFNAE